MNECHLHIQTQRRLPSGTEDKLRRLAEPSLFLHQPSTVYANSPTVKAWMQSGGTNNMAIDPAVKTDSKSPLFYVTIEEVILLY